MLFPVKEVYWVQIRKYFYENERQYYIDIEEFCTDKEVVENFLANKLKGFDKVKLHSINKERRLVSHCTNSKISGKEVPVLQEIMEFKNTSKREIVYLEVYKVEMRSALEDFNFKENNAKT